MRSRPTRSRFLTIALPIVLFIAGISATCGVSKGETRDRQSMPQEASKVLIAATRS